MLGSQMSLHRVELGLMGLYQLLRRRGEDATGFRRVVYAFLDAHRARLKRTDAGTRLDGRSARELIRDCGVLAALEQPYRIGTDRAELAASAHELRTVGALRAAVPDVVVDDVSALVPAAAQRLLPLCGAAVRSGLEFTGSNLVGGADADLLLDGLLLDVKTTIQAKLRREHIYQLLGYVLLDFDDAYAIDRAGFFLPRQDALVAWPVTEMVERTSAAGWDVATARDELCTFLRAQRRATSEEFHDRVLRQARRGRA